jgi:hypothetical protein
MSGLYIVVPKKVELNYSVSGWQDRLTNITVKLSRIQAYRFFLNRTATAPATYVYHEALPK